MIIGLVWVIDGNLVRAHSREQIGVIDLLLFESRKFSQFNTQNFTTQPTVFGQMFG